MNSNWIWATLLVLLALLIIAVRFAPKIAKSHHVVLPKSSATVDDLTINCPSSCKSILKFNESGSKIMITCMCPQDSGLE